MSWHYLQGQEEVSSEAICWDGERFAPSNGPTTLGGYCLPDSATECCHDSRSGTTCSPSTEPLGEDESMLSQGDFLARTFPQPEREPESTAHDPECGTTWRESLARYDHDSRSWKTPQCSLLEGLDEFSETWPRWGTMRNGVCWERTTLELPTSATGSGFSELLPTPLASLATHGGPNQRDSSGRPGLQMAAMMWPTPRAGNPGSRPNGNGGRILAEEVMIAEGLRERGRSLPTPCTRDWKSGTGAKERPGHALPLSSAIGGQLNPDWVEWLMWWPLGWTDLKPLGMDRFQQWQQQHSGFCRNG